MPISLPCCADFLAQEGVRHHLDVEAGAILVAFVTRQYQNARGEKLAVVRIDLPDEGYRFRVALDRAFPVGQDAAAACATLCRLAADTPLVRIEFDAAFENLRMVIDAVVEDGSLTRLQVLSMVDRLVEAAEAWHAALADLHRTRAATPDTKPGRRRPRAA